MHLWVVLERRSFSTRIATSRINQVLWDCTKRGENQIKPKQQTSRRKWTSQRWIITWGKISYLRLISFTSLQSQAFSSTNSCFNVLAWPFTHSFNSDYWLPLYGITHDAHEYKSLNRSQNWMRPTLKPHIVWVSSP